MANVQKFIPAVKEACRENRPLFSLFFFSKLANSDPDCCKLETCQVPWFHRMLYDLGANRKIKNKSVAVPREHAKSTILCDIGVTHDILYENEKYIKMFTRTRRLAGEHLDTIKRNLEYNDLLRDFYGTHYSNFLRDQQYELITGNGIKITAQGLDSEGRGSKFYHYRISKLIVDDPQMYIDCLNPQRRENIRRTIGTDLLYALHRNIGHAIAIGTIVHHDCYIANCLNDPRFKPFFLQAILNDDNAEVEKFGERRSLWERQFKLKELDEERRIARLGGNEEEWLQERMNIPISAKRRLTNTIREWDGTFRRSPGTASQHNLFIDGQLVPIHVFSGIDFAVSKNEEACWTVALTIGIDADENIYLLDLWNEKTENPVDSAIHLYYQAYRFGSMRIYAEKAGTLPLMNKTINIFKNEKTAFRALVIDNNKKNLAESRPIVIPENTVDAFIAYKFPNITPHEHKINDSGKDGRILDTLSPYFNRSKILHKEWMSLYKAEALTFPQSKTKDVMDILQILVEEGIKQKPKRSAIPEMENISPTRDYPNEPIKSLKDLRQYQSSTMWAN